MVKAKVEGGAFYTVSVRQNADFNSFSKTAEIQMYNYGQKERDRERERECVCVCEDR